MDISGVYSACFNLFLLSIRFPPGSVDYILPKDDKEYCESTTTPVTLEMCLNAYTQKEVSCYAIYNLIM